MLIRTVFSSSTPLLLSWANDRVHVFVCPNIVCCLQWNGHAVGHKLQKCVPFWRVISVCRQIYFGIFVYIWRLVFRAIDQLTVRMAILGIVIAIALSKLQMPPNIRNFICSFHFFLSLIQFIFAQTEKKGKHDFFFSRVRCSAQYYKKQKALVNWATSCQWIVKNKYVFFIGSIFFFLLINLKAISDRVFVTIKWCRRWIFDCVNAYQILFNLHEHDWMSEISSMLYKLNRKTQTEYRNESTNTEKYKAKLISLVSNMQK